MVPAFDDLAARRRLAAECGELSYDCARQSGMAEGAGEPATMDWDRQYGRWFWTHRKSMTLRPLNRNRIIVGLFAVLLVLDVSALVLEKVATMASVKDIHTAFYLSLIGQPWLWLGLAIGPFQLWVWTCILARTELSVAYPISTISYPLTMVVPQFFFGEQLGWQVWLGAVFMIIGVAVIGSTTGHSRNMRMFQPVAKPAAKITDTHGMTDERTDALRLTRTGLINAP